MAKAKGFIRKFGPLNPTLPFEPQMDEGEPYFGLTTTLQKPLAELLVEMQSAARVVLDQAGVPSARDFQIDTVLKALNPDDEPADERLDQLACLPDQVNLAFQLDWTLDVLQENLRAGNTEKAARMALFAGILAHRTHAVPWEEQAIREELRQELAKLPLLERQRLGARAGQERRWREQNRLARRWRLRAGAVWRKDPALSISAVARTIAADLGGNVNTIRRRIAELKSGAEQ